MRTAIITLIISSFALSSFSQDNNSSSEDHSGQSSNPSSTSLDDLFSAMESHDPENQNPSLSKDSPANHNSENSVQNEGKDLFPLSLTFWAKAKVDDVDAVYKAGKINLNGEDGETPIMLAVATCADLAVVDQLVNLGADVNTMADDGMSVLSWADLNSPEMVAHLIKLGADVNYKNDNGTSVLMYAAASTKNPSFIESLISVGANVNATNASGTSVLMWASSFNDSPKIIEQLIEHGANVNYKDQRGRTALIVASKDNGNSGIHEQLIKAGADIESKGPAGNTALITAAIFNPELEVVKRLVALGADINATNSFEQTALMASLLYNKNPEISAFLLEVADTSSVDPIKIARILNSNKQHLKAVEWAKKGAISGDTEAQLYLGAIYSLGNEGIGKDAKEAVKWYRLAAEQGDALAQLRMGVSYSFGAGVTMDKAEAFKWYRMAALQGDSDAQHNLSVSYATGAGVLEDDIEAYAWALLAASNSSADSKMGCKAWERQLSNDHAIAAQARARELQEMIQQQSRLSALAPGQDPASAGVDPSGYGSGLLIKGGYILTCWHVVDSAKTVTVSIGGQDHVMKVVRKDPGNDIAVLHADTLNGGVSLSTSSGVGLGQKVFTLGYPHPELQGSGVKFTTGSISGLMGPNDTPRYYQISAPLQAGNSGGPLFDEQGNLAGMVAAKLDSVATLMATGDLPQNVNYAIKMDYILPLLKTVDGIDLSPAQQKNVGLLELIDELKQSAVMIKVY